MSKESRLIIAERRCTAEKKARRAHGAVHALAHIILWEDRGTLLKYNGLQVRLWRLYGASHPLHGSRSVSLWRLGTQAAPNQRTQVSPVVGIHVSKPRGTARRSSRFDRHNNQVIVQWQCGEEIKVCARRPIVAPKCLPYVEGKSSLMFMFRSRKTNLTKRLVKARKRRGNETRRTVEEETDTISTLLKKLQENQLEMLLRAIDTTGKDLSNCVLMPQNFGEEPHVLCCQTWRWPDLRQGSELRRLPMCRSASDPVYICCNPYHWSRLCQPGEYLRSIVRESAVSICDV